MSTEIISARDLLAAVANGTKSIDEVAPLLKLGTRQLTLKVSAKGALSVYGLQRMPITLYPSQWIRIFEMEAEIRQFMAENEDKFSKKKD